MEIIIRLIFAAVFTLMISPCPFVFAQEDSKITEVLEELKELKEDALNDESIEDVEDVDERLHYRYVPNPKRVKLKTTVNDFIIARFKSGEPINIRVPQTSKAIGSVMIKKPQSFKPAPLSLRPNTFMDGRQMIVELLPHLLDRLDYQPIKLELFQSDVDAIRLIPSRRNLQGDSAGPVRTTAARPNFYLRLKPENGVSVSLTGVNSFHLKNDIVDLDIPFDHVEAVFFDTEEDGVASVVLRNGDSISGKHDWPEEVEFETPWGSETISLDRLVSVTRHPSIKLVPSGVENPKWVLFRQ